MTKVRLTDAETWPKHNSLCLDDTVEGWPKARGMVIVIGAPTKPQKQWICGTDVVWPVISWDKNLGQCDGAPYVCRHQIQAGD